MDARLDVTRRGFVSGLAASAGVLGLPSYLFAARRGTVPRTVAPRVLEELQQRGEDYDALAKIANNENPWGPPESVMKAMTGAFK
jgi:hypothetical protein